MIILCDDCIEAIRSHGDRVIKICEKDFSENPEAENIHACEFCDCPEDEDILYHCEF